MRQRAEEKRKLKKMRNARIKSLGVLIIVLSLFLCNSLSVCAYEDEEWNGIALTEEEEIYLEEHPVIKLATTPGAAPISYATDDGDIQGIVRSVTDRIGKMLGVTFEYSAYDSIEEAQEMAESEAVDILMIPKNYAKAVFPDMQLTDPFLTSSTVLFFNSSVQPDSLSDKTCAVVTGDKIPDGVSEEHVKYYETRIDTIEAVHDGRADYAYGNEFSVAYYTGIMNYQNISTFPVKQDERAYCYGMVTDPEILLSIMNKAVDQLDTREMQTLILSSCVVPDEGTTLEDVIEQFAVPIVAGCVLLLLALIAVVVYVFRTNRKLNLQNLRLTTIAEVSGDLLFEYDVATETLMLSKQFCKKFQVEKSSKAYDKSVIAGIVNLDEVLERHLTGEEVTLPSDQSFKATYSYVNGAGATPIYLIGKLVDISEEKAALESLSQKAKIDGLTHILNSEECKAASRRYLEELYPGQKDALLIIDIDQFKEINDTFGHYEGDRVLIRMAAALRASFRSQDIVGRLGGDEFLVYMRAANDATKVEEKCKRLLEKLHFPLEKGEKTHRTSVSIGVHMIAEKETFEDAYQKADEALYKVKSSGKDNYCI